MTTSRRARAAAAPPLLVSVLTCARPRGVSYLAGTLRSVDAEISGDVPRVLVCDGDEVLWPGWTSLVVPPRNRGGGARPDNKVPGWVAIWTAWEMGADLLFLEDDVRGLRPGAFSSMADHAVPDGAAFTSFFAKLRGPGTHPASTFQMSQAVKIPYRSLATLANAKTTDPLQWLAITGVDLAIGAFGRIAGWTFEQTPNLVEHIGLWSAAHPQA